MPGSLDDGKAVKRGCVVAPLSTDALGGRQDSDALVVANRRRAEADLAGNLRNRELRHVCILNANAVMRSNRRKKFLKTFPLP